MKIYTKTGDKGKTDFYDNKRASKDCIIFDVLGEIDELTSRIGMLYAVLENTTDFDREFLKVIQQVLQDINSNIATIDKTNSLPSITDDHVIILEKGIDDMDTCIHPLKQFILPGMSIIDSHAHLCRTQTRKVERLLWELNSSNYSIQIINAGKKEILDFQSITVDPIILKFINRLSDYFFTLARFLIKELLPDQEGL